jgi:Ca2+-binding RTX toxin-like protein
VATITIEGSVYTYDEAIIGSNALADVLVGTDDEVLYYITGLDQNDTLTGAASNDIVVGGRGSDVLTGSAGNDVLIGDHVDAEGNIVGDATVVVTMFEGISPPGDNANWKAWENYQNRLEGFFDDVDPAASYKLDGVVVSGQALLDAWDDYNDNLTIDDVHVISGKKIENTNGNDTANHDITDNFDLWEELTDSDDQTEFAAFLDFGRIEPVGGQAPVHSVDTAVFAGLAEDYTVVVSPDSITVEDNVGTDGFDTLIGIERLEFSDRTLELTWFSKTAALSGAEITQLCELYVASFDRAPDALGLAYWGSQLKDGMSLKDIAKSFFVQPETVAAFPHGQSIEDFIAAVYDHVLERAPDAPGLAYWGGELGRGHVSKDSFLLAIINGAHAGGADAQVLANKGMVGAHFALTQGLNDIALAKAVMAGVNASAESVASANIQTDGFAASADSDISVKIVGIAG